MNDNNKNVEVLERFGKVYECMDNVSVMQRKFHDAWEITLDFPETKLTTCYDGWACIEGNLSAADAAAIEARLDALFELNS